MRTTMRLSLVGMSGSGKSYWSNKLARSGFRSLCCDDMIAAGLLGELGRKGASIEALGRWMGFPFDPRYKEREAAYLACEKEVMNRILGELAERGENPQEKIVVDTTGSVIYTGEEILNRLREHTVIVHLSTPTDIQKVMLETYLEKPRPVLWRDVFFKRVEETNAQALGRCYPKLLASRELQYQKLAHVTLSHSKHHQVGFAVEEFLGYVGFMRS
jgi:shikimate kinase